MTAPKHPAKYSKGIVEMMYGWIKLLYPEGGMVTILDPFAGVGGIHQLADLDPNMATTGLEIEKVWADASPYTRHGDALHAPFVDGYFDVIATSPTYGNRLADKHKVGGGSGESKPWIRRSYTHDLREATGDPEAELDENNSGRLQWGEGYMAFHRTWMFEANRLLGRRRASYLILNVSDHVRAREVVEVCKWWEDLMLSWGYKTVMKEPVPTRRLRFGQNHEARVDHEMLYCFKKPEAR